MSEARTIRAWPTRRVVEQLQAIERRFGSGCETARVLRRELERRERLVQAEPKTKEVIG